MKQSQVMSLVEAVANVLAGFGIAVISQILIFPAFGVQITLAQNVKLASAFTLISICRSYALRRIFVAIRVRRPK